MLLKIRVRAALLKCWETTRFRNFSHPLSHYVYYEGINSWMPVLKEMKSSGMSIEDIVIEFLPKLLQGICPKKFYSAVSSNEKFKLDDLIDKTILNHINSLVDGDEKLIEMMIGNCYSLKYGR